MKRDLDKIIEETKKACKDVLIRNYKEMGLDISSLDYAEQESKRREVQRKEQVDPRAEIGRDLDTTKPESIKLKTQRLDEETAAKLGRDAIATSYLLFKQSGFEMLQPDWILWYKGVCYCVEIKHQTPMDGKFYAPIRQIKARLRLEETFGIKAVLMILNRVDERWYWQYMSKLPTDSINKKYGNYLFPISDFVPSYFSIE